MPPARPLEERFWEKVNRTESCWLWTGSQHPLGYGRIGVGRTIRLAHRVSYELLVGPIPDGLELDHLCRTPACVRPDHLEPVTHAENMRRGYGASGRNYRARACKSGHPWTPENTHYRKGSGSRYCRACARLNNRVQSRRRSLRRKALRLMDRSIFESA